MIQNEFIHVYVQDEFFNANVDVLFQKGRVDIQSVRESRVLLFWEIGVRWAIDCVESHRELFNLPNMNYRLDFERQLRYHIYEQEEVPMLIMDLSEYKLFVHEIRKACLLIDESIYSEEAYGKNKDFFDKYNIFV